MHTYGSIAVAQKLAKNFAGVALNEFVKTFDHLPDSDDKRFILELILYMVERDR